MADPLTNQNVVVTSGTLGLVSQFAAGTISTLEEGTVNVVESGTLGLVNKISAGTIDLISQLAAGTVNTLEEGTVSVLESGTLGLVGKVQAGTIDKLKAGTVDLVSQLAAGTINTLEEGTVSVVESGTLGLVNKLTNDPDFLAAVNAGQVAGYSLYHQWGRSNALDTTKRVIWDAGDAEYFYEDPAVPEGYRLSCSDDTATQDIVVETLNSAWGTVLGTHTLTGQTPVNIGTNIRAYRMKCIGPGRDTVPGTTYVCGSGAITAGVPLATMVRAMILTPNNQSLMCVFPVPAGRTAYVVSYWASVNKASGVAAAAVDVELWVGGTGMPFQIKGVQSVNTIGGNPIYINSEEEPVIQKSDIELRGVCSAACDVSAGFDILMKDN